MGILMTSLIGEPLETTKHPQVRAPVVVSQRMGLTAAQPLLRLPWQVAEKSLTDGVAAILYRQNGNRINSVVAA
jgi:hypothetical protein